MKKLLTLILIDDIEFLTDALDDCDPSQHRMDMVAMLKKRKEELERLTNENN
jgi:hypothetical protein